MSVHRHAESAALPSATSRHESRRTLALVILASLALSITISLTLPLLDPDEGRNAEVAREMAVSGDLVIPHLAGMPYLDKPPGFFWAAALCVRALGHTPFAARLPSVLASIVLLLLFARASERAGGGRFAAVAVALLASAPLYAGLSAYVIFDMALALCVSVVWLGVAREAEDGDLGASPSNSRGRLARRLLMFAAIAAGILVKGPVMLAWALGGSLGSALMLRSFRPLAWLAWLPGWLLALGIPGAWFAAASARFPEYPHYAFVEESFERLTSNTFHRHQGWWFVPIVLVAGTIPWSLMTPWRAVLGKRLPARVSSTARVALGFLAFSVLFFSISRSQLVTYLLPALPPLAWLAATAWCEIVRTRRGLQVRLAISLTLAALIVAGASLVAFSSLKLESGAPLADAIRQSGAGPVLYERCYSPGTDFLLGRASQLISERGEETTSNYIVRYRSTLMARGLWRGSIRFRPASPGFWFAADVSRPSRLRVACSCSAITTSASPLSRRCAGGFGRSTLIRRSRTACAASPESGRPTLAPRRA